MLINDLVNDINNGTITVKKFAEINKISEKKLRNAIKNVGYVYKDKKYILKGNIDISNLYIDEVLEDNLSINDLENDNNNVIELHNKEVEKVNELENNEERDVIGAILSGSYVEEDKKVVKTVYFDSEIAKIIDSIPKKARSILINEILKNEFKNRGLI